MYIRNTYDNKLNRYICNVCSVKKDTKRSSALLLGLVSFFTEQTLDGAPECTFPRRPIFKDESSVWYLCKYLQGSELILKSNLNTYLLTIYVLTYIYDFMRIILLFHINEEQKLDNNVVSYLGFENSIQTKK